MLFVVVQWQVYIKGGKLVEAHGSFSTASCVRCKSKQDPEVVKVCVWVYVCCMVWMEFRAFFICQATIFLGQIPRCSPKYCMVSIVICTYCCHTMLLWYVSCDFPHRGSGEIRYCVLWRRPPHKISFLTTTWLFKMWSSIHHHGNISCGTPCS